MAKEMKDDKKKSSKAKGKMSALKNLHRMASDMMGEDMKKGMGKMKAVSVMAKDKGGLKKGLQKAEDLVDGGADDDQE